MKAAVAANGTTLEDFVAEGFEKSTYLLIVETDDMSYEVYQNQEQIDGFGLAMAQKLIDEDCEVLISGTIEEPAFEALVEAQTTRYLGINHSAREAIALMQTYQLDLIREYNGKEWDPNSHEHEDDGDYEICDGTCNCEDPLKEIGSMSSYTDIAIEHFMCPRNIGSMNNADGEGTCGDPECGDSLDVFIKVKNNIIEDISYLVFGCPGSVATSSMTSVMAKGKTLEKAQEITEDDIINALGGLPESKKHCSNLGVEALKNAIKDYKGKSKNSTFPPLFDGQEP